MESDKIKRYIYKHQRMFAMVGTVKLWPSRSGILHGVKRVELRGPMMEVETHCGERFAVWDSKASRSARWLRNRWFKKPCPRCKIPPWKLEKYSATLFTGDPGRIPKGGRP